MIDWNRLKAKYSNPQYHFEWFCYLLFCRKYNQPYGISRYANQSAIETFPIQDEEGNDVGFQAKFYDTSLSSHKDELLDMLEKAKRDYPNLNRVYLFTNQEWGQKFQNKVAQDPAGKIEIEEKAQALNVDLIWNTKSFFESEFVSLKCKDIVDYFFADQAFLDTVQLFKSHTENILSSIKSELNFNSEEIVLPREPIKIPNQTCIVIHGMGGIGKTVEIKKLHQQVKDREPFYLFKATEFSLSRLVDFYPKIDIQAFLSAFQDSERKTIIIDSAEKIFDLENDEPFKEFITLLVNHHWQIIFTTRNSYLNDLSYVLTDRLNLNPFFISMESLTREELFSLADSHNFLIPDDEKVTELLTTPFYLNHYLSHYDISIQNFSYPEFKENLWNSLIRKSQPEREAKFLDVVKRKILARNFFIDATTTEGVESLLQDEILSYEKGSYFITHDLYEEWALNKIIEQEYLRKELSLNFFQSITSALPIRRAFRQWISEKLLLDHQEFLNNLYDCIEEETLEQYWKDEILTSLLLSKYAGAFFNYFRSDLLQNDELFKKICFILRISCKTTDTSLFKNIGIKQTDLINYAQYLITQPKGEGWKVLINFIYQNRCFLIERHINQILPILQDWVLKNKEGKTTRLAGLITLELYKQSDADEKYLRDNNDEKELLRILSNSAFEIKEELEALADEMLKNNINSSEAPYFSFAKYLLTSMEAWSIAKVIPTKTLALARLFWLEDDSDKKEFFPSFIEDEEKFGVTVKYPFQYFPASALQTPLFVLFNSNFYETLDFTIKFVNQLISNYVELSSNSIKEISLTIDKKRFKQYSSIDLWLAYRGMFACSNLLQSILMILEKKLLFLADICKKTESIRTLNNILKKIIQESNSVALTAIVSSIINAYPEKTYPTAKILFSNKEPFLLDIHRFTKDLQYENNINLVRSWLGRSKSMEDIYEQERDESGKLEHRKKSHLETLFLDYQLFNNEDLTNEQFLERSNELWGIVEEYRQAIAQESYDDTNWSYILARLDVRTLNKKVEKKEDHVMISLQPQLPKELEKKRLEHVEETQETYQYTKLRLWADYKLKADVQFKTYDDYEDNPLSAYLEMEKCIEQGFNTDRKILVNRAIPEIVASALIKFHSDILDKEKQVKCKDIIWQRLSSTLLESYSFSYGDAVDTCFYVLPDLLELFPELIHETKLLLILSLFHDYNIGMGSNNYRNMPLNVCIRLQENYPKEMESVVLGYLYFAPLYFEYQQIFHKPHREISNAIEAFWKKHSGFLEKTEYNEFDAQHLPDLEKIVCSNKVTLFLLVSQSNNPLFKKLCDELIRLLLPGLLSDDLVNRYHLRNDFLELFALYILRLEDQQQIKKYLSLIIEVGDKDLYLYNIFDEFLLAQDKYQQYDNFWFIWKELESFILDIALDRKWISNSTEVILKFLFASPIWKKDVKKWHTFQPRNRRFFKSLSSQLPCKFSILYAYAKLLNGLGYETYFKEGLTWFNHLINNESTQNNRDGKYKDIAIDQMENYIRNYIYQFTTEIRKQKSIKENVIAILNWLIEQGSVAGYLLREKIL